MKSLDKEQVTVIVVLLELLCDWNYCATGIIVQLQLLSNWNYCATVTKILWLSIYHGDDCATVIAFQRVLAVELWQRVVIPSWPGLKGLMS